MPPSASSNRPFFCRSAPVKAPRSWPKSSLSSRCSGSAAQLTDHELAAPGHVAVMDRLGHQLLAGPGLAGHEHGAARRGDALHPREHLHHPAAPAQEVVVGVAPAEPVAQVGHLVDQAAVLERLVDQQLEPDRVDRLLEEVVGAQLHRLDGRLHRGVGRHDDDRDRQVAVANLADQVEAVDARQTQVGEDQREGPLDQPFQRGRAVVGHVDLAVGHGQQLRELLADQLAVVHHEDASIHGALIQVEAGGHDLGVRLRKSLAASSTGCTTSLLGSPFTQGS